MDSSSIYSKIEQDVAFLIVQFLDEHNLTESARTFEREAKLIFNMKYVEEAVKDGKWKELEAYVLDFTRIKENQWSTKMIFEIRRQKYIEALDNGQHATALEILTNELQTIVDDEETYNEIAQLICLNNVRENGKYYTDTETARRSVFADLKGMIEMNPVLKDKLNHPILEDSRLKVLMNHSLNWQHHLCKYPEAIPIISTLYVDHTCGDEVVLSLNDGVCRGLGYLTPSKTDERKRFIVPEISEQAQLLSLRLPDPILSSKIDRLTYDNSGYTIFALSTSGVLKFWKLKVEETNAAGEATPRITCEHSRFLANDIGREEHELVVPCFALSKNDSYVTSASGGKASLFCLQASGFEFKNLATFMFPPPAATCVAFYPKDNNLVIFGMEKGYIRIYDVRTGEVKAQKQAHDEESRVTGLAYSSTLNILVSSAYNAEICSWEKFPLIIKRSSIFLGIEGRAVCPGRTCVKFHQNQKHMLVVHESCLVTLEGPHLEACTQWTPGELICDATYSCDGHTIYASCVRGHIVVLDSSSFALRCIINPSAYIPLNPSLVVYASAIAAHPSKPNQFVIGLSDGCVLTVEPREEDWPGRPKLDNVVAA